MTIIKDDKPKRAQLVRLYNTTTRSSIMLPVYVSMIKDKYAPKVLTDQEIITALREEFRFMITRSAFDNYYETMINEEIDDKRLQAKNLGIVYDEEQQEIRVESRNTDRTKA